jgi:predicted transcriptional regulator of viral defense system
MPTKKGKTISFDAMVKFFMQNYNIPTKKDVESKTAVTAVDMVFDAIKRSRQGLGFSDIQAKTGFGDKKIRNIIFRLNKTGKIKRKSRGIYVAA